MNLSRNALFALLLASPLAAADLSGHWIFEGDVSGNAIRLDCELRQDGARLEGGCKTENGDVKLAGEVNDPKIRFSYAINYQGTTYTLYYTGIIESATALSGDIEVSGTRGTFAAKKEAGGPQELAPRPGR